MDRKKVLIVEDSLMIRDVLQKAVEKCGCTVCGVAKNGKEGVELFNLHRPDVIFMDINMPIMDGIDATKMIKEASPEAKVVMLTSLGDDEIQAQCKELGVSFFIKKPFDLHDIISAIASVL